MVQKQEDGRILGRTIGVSLVLVACLSCAKTGRDLTSAPSARATLRQAVDATLDAPRYQARMLVSESERDPHELWIDRDRGRASRTHDDSGTDHIAVGKVAYFGISSMPGKFTRVVAPSETEAAEAVDPAFRYLRLIREAETVRRRGSRYTVSRFARPEEEDLSRPVAELTLASGKVRELVVKTTDQRRRFIFDYSKISAIREPDESQVTEVPVTTCDPQGNPPEGLPACSP